MPRFRRSVRVGDIVTLQSPDMGSISASCVGGTCRADLLEGPVQMPPNIRDCRFQVYPHFRYVCRDALRKLELGGVAAGHRARILRSNAEAEEENNRREFENLLGAEVRHGMVIQLLHLSTGKFLTAGQAIARLERDCFRISLSEGDRNSGWGVCPVFQFQQSGHPLQYQDDFYLEATGKRGFLHISDAPDQTAVSLSSYIKDTFEVNCATSRNRLRFSPYRDCQVHASKEASGCLYGDDVVSIQLREHGSVLAATISGRGCQAEDARPRVFFAADCKSRLQAATVWKIEAAELQQAGDAVAPLRAFRVKHVASGLYMALANPEADVQDICLTSDYHSADGSTLWEFVPVNEEEFIHRSTPLYIRNVCTDCWLQCKNVQGTFLADANSICCEEMDVSQYVYMAPAVEKDDTTTIDRMRNFRLQIIDVIKALRGSKDASPSFAALPEYADAVSSSLGKCIRLCVGGGEENPLMLDGEPQAESQHLVHEMGVLQAVVDLIECLAQPFQLNEHDEEGESTADPKESMANPEVPPGPASMLRLAYWLVKQACKGRQEVKGFLLAHLDMFTRHLPLNILASAALRELFSDNRQMLMDVPTETMGPIIDRLIRSYVRSRCPEILRIFESICVCEGAPVPAVQSRIVLNLLQRHAGSLPTLRVQPPELRVLGPSLDEGGPLEVDPRDFLGRGGMQGSSLEPQERVYCLCLCSLELFAALASGRHRQAAMILQKGPWSLSRASLVSIVKDFTCPSAFRRACLAVLEKLYIDHGEMKVIPAISYTRVWREAVAKVQDDGAEGRRHSADVPAERSLSQDSPTLPVRQPEPGRRHSDTVLAESPRHPHPHWQRLALLKHTSRTTTTLRRSAQVECSDMESMVNELHGILSGVIRLMEQTVAERGSQEASLHAFASGGDRVEDVRFASALLECIGLLANFGLLRLGDSKEQALVRCVTDTLITFLSLPITSRPMQHCKISACSVLQRIFALRTDHRLTSAFEAYECSWRESDTWPEVFQKLFKDLFETPIISEKVMVTNMGTFVDSLLYTISSGVELDVKSKCWNLLFLHTGQRAYMVREAMKVTVLALPEAVSVYHEVVQTVADLGALMPDIVLSREVQMQGANRRACVLIASLTELCKPSGEEDSSGGHLDDTVQKHQDVLRDLGAQRCLLQILRLPLRRRKVKLSLDEAVDTVRLDLFQRCYEFLQLFVRGNTQNQELMFPHIGLFMSHVGVERLDVGGLVAAVVEDNSALVAQMSDTDLRTFVQAIAKYGKRARWLHSLQSMLRVKGQWIRRNQNVVLGLLLEDADLVLELDGHEEGALEQEDRSLLHSRSPSKAPTNANSRSILLREGNRTRLQLMAARDQDQGGSSFLLYHVTCLTLLANCCAGRNQSNQSKCRGLLSVEEVINSITSCHRDSFGTPAAGIDADTVRFVRGAWLKFLHHCLVDSAPHELFSCSEALWGEDDTSLTGVLLAEVAALGDALQAGETPSSEQLDFVFYTCLPLYAGLVKGFAPRPLPDPARRLMFDVASCCDALAGRWKEGYLAEADKFFAAFSVVEDLNEDANAAKERLDVVSRCSRMSFLDGASEAHVQALDFREGFGRFVEGLSWSVSVNPAEVVGNGLRDLVAIIHGQEELLAHLADVLVREAAGPSENTPFLMNCIRAVRGYLCGIQPVGVGPESNWQSFVNKEVPSDSELARRQEVAAGAGLVASLASILVHSNMRIVREALLSFQVFFASPSLKGRRAPQEALVRHVGGEAQRQHFVSACLEIIGKCMQDLREREVRLQTKLEQRLARRRALRRRWSSNGTETTFTTDDETSDSSSHDGQEAMLEDGDLDLGSAPGFADQGPPLELLTVLTSCLAGGRRELQDMLLVTDTAKAANQEDLLADLVKYVALSEKLVVTSLAQGHKGPLQIILQAFKFFQEVIRGPNTRAVEALVLHTEIAVIIRDLLKQLRCAGPAMELKFKLRSQILTFTLDMLQNLGPGQTAMPRKLISQECDQGFLQAWEEAHEMAMREEKLNQKDVQHQRFLCYAVLAYLADASLSPALWREVASRAEAFQSCRRSCGFVEVAKNGEALPLRFRLPPICEQLRSQEGFKSKVASLVYECIGDEELERARAALFLRRLTALIAKEVRHYELVGHGFLGALVGYQNWVRRLPLLATVLMNIWLLCFEAKLFAELMGQDTGLTEAVAAAHGLVEGEVCGGPEAASCLSTVAPPGGAEAPSTRPPASLLTAAMYGCELLLAAFHFVCYLLRFVLVLGTSTQRRERQVESTLLLFSFLGNALSPFFFVTHVLEFFGAQSARMLLSAATLNLSKLGQAGLIIMLTVYLYAVVGFQLFKDKHTEGKCSTLLNCAMSYLDGGLTGNGIHEALELKTPRSLWGTPALEWFLQLFAMSFLAILVQVLLAIFSGIIIDSFGELRDRHAEITSHLSEQNHLLAHGVYWNYVDFLVFLHVSDPGGLSDLEAYVYGQVEAGSSAWLPYRLSLDLQPGSRLAEQEAEAQQEEAGAAAWVDGEQLEEVKARLDGLERRLDALAPDDRSPEARRFRRAATTISSHLDGEGERSPSFWTKPASDTATPAVRNRLARLEKNSEERLAAVEDQLYAIRQLLEAAAAQRGDRGGAAARQHLADGHRDADLRG